MPMIELQGIEDDQVRRGLDSLNGFAEGLGYRPYFPVELFPINGAVEERVTIGGTARDMSGYRFPVGAALPGLVGSFGVPPGWVTGSVLVELELCGTAASTATFTLNANIDPVADGEVPAQAALGTWTVAGQATAGAKFRTKTALVQVAAPATLCGFKFLRSTPDANAGDLYVLGFRPFFYPRSR